MYDVYVVVKRSICYSSLASQKEKGLSDLKFREEICLSVCVSLLKRSLCEDESQKDFFEREDEYNEANTGPLKSQERFFLNKTSLFCVSETFGARKGISGNAQHHVHHNIFLSFTLALLILSRRSDEKRAKSREEQKRETRAIARARVQLAEKERERERESTRRISLTFFLLFFFKGVVVVDFFAFFRPNLGAQIEALESFTKREIPQRYKI